eukprot:7857289-Pyramimonas_sp.AAC.1
MPCDWISTHSDCSWSRATLGVCMRRIASGFFVRLYTNEIRQWRAATSGMQSDAVGGNAQEQFLLQ